ncbi:MAG: DUF86 domain-containing protein [Candidatus Margulisbacteria bacterium]|nr:DUF86 domain-containing protein [Candidatus Margulisiibacteriota bacterium]
MRRPELFLKDMSDASANILAYTKDFTIQQFKKDQKTIDAVIRNIEIIGEAANKVPEELKTKYSHIEWRESTAMRNIVMHEYFGVDLDIIWETVLKDISKIKQDVDLILSELASDN